MKKKRDRKTGNGMNHRPGKGKFGSRMLCLLAAALFLFLPGALGEGRVFLQDETEPFPDDAELLTIRVAGILGGDCMLMTLGEHSMFVDLGTDKCYPKVRELIDAAGIDHVEYFFNTHPHTDHVGGFMPLAGSGFPIGTMFTFFPHDYTGKCVLQKLAMNTAKEYGIPVRDLKTGDAIPFGKAELTAYRVPDKRITRAMNANDLSATLMVRYGDCSILLAADIEVRAQLTLVDEYDDLKADILKFPHHGVAPAKNPFLKKVNPEFVVFTHGSSDDTLRAQKQLQAYRKGRMAFAAWGVITLQSDGHKWIVTQKVYPEKERQVEFYIREHAWTDTPPKHQ